MADQTLIGKQLYTTVFTQTVKDSTEFAKVRTNTRFRSLHNDAIYFKDNNGFITTVPQGYFPILNQNTTGNAATSTTATTVITNADLTGEVTSVGNVTTVLNATVIEKVLTGYVSGAGVLAATDTILQGFQKLNGNISAMVSGVSSVTGTANRITTSPTTGAVVVDISASYGGQTSITTVGALTTGSIGAGFTAIANASLANSTISGISLGSNLATLTIGTGLSGTSYNGSAPTTIAIDSSVVTLTGSQALTNKTGYNGLVITANTGVITTGTWNGTTVAIANGGTGQTTANTALNALLPSQTTHSGKTLQTDGTNTSWVADGGGTVTNVSSANGAATIANPTTTPVITIVSAPILTTARTIGGASFDGSANITPLNTTVANEGTDTTCFPTFVTAATGDLPQRTNAALTYNSNTGSLASTIFVGALTGNASTATLAATVTTNANLTGEVMSVGNAATITNSAVIGKVITGYVSGAGTVAATDSILQAIQKLNGNTTALVTGVSSVNSLTGAVALTGTANRITISAANVFDISASYVGQASITTLGTITTGVWAGTAIANANLANSTITLGSTSMALGTTNTTIVGLVSVTSTAFVGALTGNSSTATALQNARTIGGVSFDGTANIVPQTIQSINEATDTTCFPLFISASGSQSLQPLNNSGFTYNSNTNTLTATTFIGAITGNATTATALATGRTIGITGDLVYTSPSFDGSANVTAAGTLATVNSNVGSFGASTSIPTFTVNAKGLITAASGNVVIAPAGTLTGATLAANVLASSLTSVGTLLNLTVTNTITGSVSGSATTLATGRTIGITGDVTYTSPIFDGSGNVTSTATVNSANNLLEGYTTVATAAGTTTLTVSSTFQQYFTGSTTQILKLPVANTLTLGQQFLVVNNSTGAVTINSSGSNVVQVMVASSICVVTCILTSGTTAASWSVSYVPSMLSTNTASTLVLRDASGNFSAGTITANLTGNATTVTTIPSLSGEVTSSANAITLVNSAVIGKVITGYTSGAGTVAATDTILQAIQKLNGNIGTLVSGVSSVNSLTGAVALTGTASRVTVSAANVFDISASYVGQSSITTLGTITTGVWTGTAIANANLANSTITLGSTSMALGTTNTTIAGLVSVTSTTFVGALTGSISGNAATVTVANEAVDTTCFPTFVTATTGSLVPKTNAALTYNSATGVFASSTFAADGGGNSYTFRGTASTGTTWNLYMDGTDKNYLAGSLGVLTTAPQASLHVVGEGAAFPATSGTTTAGLITRLQGGGSNAVLDIGNYSGFGVWLQATNKTDLSLAYPILLNPNGAKVNIGSLTSTNYFSVTPSQYSTGTAFQTTTAVTGVGTTFTAAMVGSQFVYSNGTSSGTITAFIDATHLTVTTSQTVSSTPGIAYNIGYTGLQVSATGNVGVGMTPVKTLDIAGTISATGHTTFEGVTSTGATGTGKLVYDGTPTLVTPLLGTPTSGNLVNCTFPTLNQNTTGTANIAGGTAGAIPYQSAAGATTVLAATATANKILLSGASAAPVWSTPTFPNASATSGKMIKSDGTNWVASTETYAAPSTNGNIMQSDGTNWISVSAPTFAGTTTVPLLIFGTNTNTLNTVKATLTAGQVATLGTGISLIAAPAAGYAIRVIRASAAITTYGGTAYTANTQLLLYTDVATIDQASCTILNATVVTHRTFIDITAGVNATGTQLLSAKGLFIRTGGNPATGNSGIDLYITYELVKL